MPWHMTCLSKIFYQIWYLLKHLEHNCHIMSKLAFWHMLKKVVDKLHGNRAADQGLCFKFMEITVPLLKPPNFKPIVIFCVCTAGLVSLSDLV